jgi:CxxC-x17-CxxC domain-containing protein
MSEYYNGRPTSFGERTTITCSVCKKEDTVPFKPREGTENTLKCRECFKGSKPKSSYDSFEYKNLEDN